MTTTLSTAKYVFGTPVREAADTDRAKPDIVSFKQWVEQLPTANTGRVTTEISQRLHILNRNDITPQHRLLLLDLIQPLAEQSIDVLLGQISGHSFPLGQKHLLLAKKLESLTQELANTYLIATNDLVNEPGNSDLSLLDTAIFMSMQCLSAQLYHSYLLYREPPSKIWQYIHQLYKCAADHSLLHQQTPGAETGEEQTTYSTRYRTEALYKKSLLLHLAGPHRLCQTDLVKLEAILEQCAEHGVLYSSADLSHGQAGFLIDLNSDVALLPFVADGKNDVNNIIYFSAIPLAKLVSQWIHSSPDDNVFQPLSTETSKRLMLSWGVLSKRLFSRNSRQRNEKKLVAAGMINTHYFMNDEESFIDAKKHESARPASHQSGLNTNSILENRNMWDKIHTSPGASDFYAPDEQIITQPSTTHSFSSHFWEVVNESAGGYCLRSNTDIPACIVIGELVSIKTIGKTENNDWEMGVIRWIKYLLEEKLEIGIQMIAPSASALAISNSKNEKQLNSRAFLLPDLQAMKQPATIVTPSMPYASGDIIDLYQGDNTERVKLLRMIDDTGCYRQFEFKKLGRPVTTY